MPYKFNNKSCVCCHEKLPTKAEVSGEVELLVGKEFKVGKCPSCGAEQRLIQVTS